MHTFSEDAFYGSTLKYACMLRRTRSRRTRSRLIKRYDTKGLRGLAGLGCKIITGFWTRGREKLYDMTGQQQLITLRLERNWLFCEDVM